MLIIAQGVFKLSQCFIGLSTQKIEVRRWHLGEVMFCLHRTCEVIDGRLLRVKRHCFFSRLLRINQGLLPHARFIAMIGQIFQASFSKDLGRSAKALQSFCEATMQPLTFPHQQSVSDSLLSQCVSKGKVVCLLFSHQLGCHYLFEQGQQMSFITAQHLPQQSNVEAPSGNSSKTQETFRIRTQVSSSLLHSFLDTSRNRQAFAATIGMWLIMPTAIIRHQFPTWDKRGKHLLDEERVALCEWVYEVQ